MFENRCLLLFTFCSVSLSFSQASAVVVESVERETRDKTETIQHANVVEQENLTVFGHISMKKSEKWRRHKKLWKIQVKSLEVES